MSRRREPPRAAKPSTEAPIWRIGAAEPPGNDKPLIPEEVWRLEAVRGRGDAEVARIAELQRGIIARAQLLAAGISAAGIKHRLQGRRLHVVHPGVYVVGRPRLEPLAGCTAAVIHLRGQGVLSHVSAARIWQLTEAPELPVEVITRATGAKTRPGIVVHRSRTLGEIDIQRCDRLPVTSPARTLVDLASTLDPDELEAAYAIACRRGLVDRSQVVSAIARASLSRGVATLRALLDRDGSPMLSRSGYEHKLIALLRRAELPAPEVNASVLGMEVDLLWREQQLVVEFDGFGFHASRAAFERDRLRDQRLVAAGFRVIRITARQLDQHPEAVLARIAAALARC